jgi:hypothetical protein
MNWEGSSSPDPQRETSLVVSPSDFFVSYAGVDEGWAVWIAWCLEAAGYGVVLQAWDFRPGDNFILMMQRAVLACRRTIVVLTDSFLERAFTQPEWADALRRDPAAEARTLIPVRVVPCRRQGGLLDAIIHIDLVGCTEDVAQQTLLAGISPARAKPSDRPPFPGRATDALP